MSAERPADGTPQRTPASDGGIVGETTAAPTDERQAPHPAPPPPPPAPEAGSAAPNPDPDPHSGSQIKPRARRRNGKPTRRQELLALRGVLEERRALDVAHEEALSDNEARVVLSEPVPFSLTPPDQWDEVGTVSHPGFTTTNGVAPHAVGAVRLRNSLRRLVFAATEEGRDIVEFFTQVFRGEGEYPVTFRTRFGVETVMVKPELKLRLDAAAWLADRAWGKATEYVKGQVTVNPMTVMRPQLLQALRDPETARLMAEASRRITLLPPGPLPLPPGEAQDGTETIPNPDPHSGNGNGGGA